MPFYLTLTLDEIKQNNLFKNDDLTKYVDTKPIPILHIIQDSSLSLEDRIWLGLTGCDEDTLRILAKEGIDRALSISNKDLFVQEECSTAQEAWLWFTWWKELNTSPVNIENDSENMAAIILWEIYDSTCSYLSSSSDKTLESKERDWQLSRIVHYLCLEKAQDV